MNGNPLNRRPGAPGIVRQGEDAGGPPVEEERVGQPDERGVRFCGCCCAKNGEYQYDVNGGVELDDNESLCDGDDNDDDDDVI